MTLNEIQQVLGEAHAQAAAVAVRSDDGSDAKILAIAIAETARATRDLAKLLSQ